MILIGLAIVSGIIFYNLDGYSIVREHIVSKYRQFRELNKLVATTYKPFSQILWVSICMVAKMYWINFLQWSNNTICKIDAKTVVVSYVLNGRLYKLVVTPRKGPNNVLLVLDNDNNDISDLVLPYMGPNQDWHRKEFTPYFWNKKSITFELSTGEQKTFTEHDTIEL